MNFLKASVSAATWSRFPTAGLFVLAASCLASVAFGSAAFAQTTYLEQSQAIKAPRAIAKIGADLFGDQVNLYTGSLEFIQSDVSLRGNSALQVAAARRFITNVSAASGSGQFGKEWALEIPRLHGVFAAETGWSVQGSNSKARCSEFSEPPDVGLWNAVQYWQGNFMYIPGQGDQQLLRRDPANNNVPSPASNYPVVTAKFWSISCLPSLANAPALGEGFLATSPEGVKYRFDHMVHVNGDSISKPSPGSMLTVGPRAELSSAMIGDSGTESAEISTSYSLARVTVHIYPTEVSDRFGNWVRYSYDPAKPGNLITISSNDGRQLTFSYDGSNRISAVTDGTRTWTYGYTGANLATVTLPDGSAWDLKNIYSLLVRVHPAVGCAVSSVGNNAITGSMTHPSGATGRFTLTAMVHGRSDVKEVCGSGTGYVPANPKYFYTYSLTEKMLGGPGLPASGYTWSYAYGSPNASWAPCGDGCPKSKTVTVTDPQQNLTRYTYGNQYRLSEGRLERVDTGWNPANSTALRTSTTSYQVPGAGPYPAMVGYGGEMIGDGEALARLMPVKETVTTQQGTTFTWAATDFDVFAKPTAVSRSSSLGHTRNETIAYHKNTSHWVLGQVESVTDGSGKVMLSNGYLPTGQLGSVTKFGRLEQSMTYHADGTLATRSDGRGFMTSFWNYKLGIPQNVSFPDGGSESAWVNNIGGIDSTTDPYANTTNYYYDAMGRLNRIAYPGSDSVAWNDTIINFERVWSDEYGLAPGHWRQTVSTGNGRTVEYLDAFWRPVLTHTSDIGDEAGTRKMTQRRFDHAGQGIFESYPQRTISHVAETVAGVTSSFDALGRVATSVADSELGPLTTSYGYLSGFKRSVINPRNYTTTTSFHALDQPSEDAPMKIEAPEGVTVDFSRDPFGKTTAITRSGGGKSATRKYVYDDQELLCKTIEPETGATIRKFDLAGNIDWQASGLNLLSASCDTDQVSQDKKVDFEHDQMNRLTKTTYGDGSPSISRTYTYDGLVKTIDSNGAVWTNNYNKRRLNESESLAYGGHTYNVRRTYDVNGALATLTYPDNKAISYSPNALGEASKVGGYATGIRYYPNGAVASFAYGNGVARTLLQNARGLPQRSTDAGVLDETYTYDRNGNTDTIGDAVAGRTMTYDGLDRLRTVAAPNLWGNATYEYDALDNITKTSISGGANARTLTHAIDAATNRLKGIDGGPAAFNFAYEYDAQGNITRRGTQAYVFDQGNRLKSATGRATYAYDGLGHRISTVGTDGVNTVQIYTQAGKLLYSGPPGSGGTKYIYLNNHVIAEVK